VDKFEAFKEYLKSPRTWWDWHGEEMNVTLGDLADWEGLDEKEELEKAFLAGVKWAQEQSANE